MRILVVDDEQTIADTLSQILTRSGFEVATAYSAEVAHDLAMIAEPQLLVSDLILGGITGIELAIRFTTDFPSCRNAPSSRVSLGEKLGDYAWFELSAARKA